MLDMNTATSINALSYSAQDFSINPVGSVIHSSGMQSVVPCSNRYTYINRKFRAAGKNGEQSNCKPKVLLNPNFSRSVHVNPHFKKPKQLIHVNPNILQQSKPALQLQPNVNDTITIPQRDTTPVLNKLLYSTNTKLIRIPNKVPDTDLTKLTSIRTKPIQLLKSPIILFDKNVEANVRKRRTSFHTTYKIIRRPAGKALLNKDTTLKKVYSMPNKFKIDRRSQLFSSVGKHSVKSPKFRNRTLSFSLNTKYGCILPQNKVIKKQYASINGCLYKKSSNAVKKCSNKVIHVKEENKVIHSTRDRGGKLLTIRGQKYKLDSNQRTLKRLQTGNNSKKSNLKRIDRGSLTCKRKEPNVFVKMNISKKQLFSQAKLRSIHILSNKMRKCNIPCLMFRRFGKCRGKDNGRCPRVHNPDQIALCTKFLQGACVDEKCLLSHKVSAEKMPTCKFYLEGLCARENCSYLHVKINAKAPICKDFLEGFCKKAVECDKRHQYLCPDYDKNTACMKRRCPYPHGIVVRKRAFLKKVTSKLDIGEPCNVGKTRFNMIKMGNSSKNDAHNFESITRPQVNANLCEVEVNKQNQNHGKSSNVRYYNDLKNATKQIKVNRKVDGDRDESDRDKTNVESSDSLPLQKRPKLGDLPSFIPFTAES